VRPAFQPVAMEFHMAKPVRGMFHGDDKRQPFRRRLDERRARGQGQRRQ
jgi:hypothetical protein